MAIETSQESNLVEGKDCVRLFNNLAFLCDDKIKPVERIEEINYGIIEKIFFSILKRRAIFSISKPESMTDEAKFANLVNFLSCDILNVSIDHIQPEDLVSADPTSIYNLLEILAACEIYLPNSGESKNLNVKATEIAPSEFAALSISLPPSSPPSPSPSPSPSSSSSSSSSSLHSKPWSSPTYSSLSNNSFSSPTLSLSYDIGSSTSTSTPTPSIHKSPSPQSSKNFTEQSIYSSRKSSKSILPSSPDSACVCSKLHDIGVNTDPVSESISDSSPLTEESLPLSMPYSSKEPETTEKIDKCTITDPYYPENNPQDKVIKQCHQKFESYEELAAHRFALEIGHKIQRALRLEESTKHIEAKLSAITGELKVNASKKHIPINRRKGFESSVGKSRILNRKITAKQITSVSMRSNIYTKPLISKNLTQTQAKLSQRIKPKAYSKLRMDNNGNFLFDEWRQQEAALIDIHSKIKSSMSLDPNSLKLKQIQERAMIREARTERARVHKLTTDLERRTCSKYLAVQAKEENLIKSQAQERLKAFREDLIAYKKMIKSQMEKEEVKRKRLLDAFQTYYQQQLSMIKEKIDQEEKNLVQRYKHHNVIYDKLRRELKSNLEKEIVKVISSK